MADFELLPPEDALSVDERLDAALSGLAPDTQPDVVRPFGRGWAFDFITGQFVAHGQSPARVDGLAQLATWIEKTLRTARFAHDIYGDSYGVDNPWEGIGFVFTAGLAAKISKNITDALLVHDRITAVTDFSFDGVGTSQLFVGFRVVTDEADDELDFHVPFGRTT